MMTAIFQGGPWDGAVEAYDDDVDVVRSVRSATGPNGDFHVRHTYRPSEVTRLGMDSVAIFTHQGAELMVEGEPA